MDKDCENKHRLKSMLRLTAFLLQCTDESELSEGPARASDFGSDFGRIEF